MPYIHILGRQPALGLAELESLYGPELVQPIGHEAATVDASETTDYDRLGGTQKVAQRIDTLPHTNWLKLRRHLKQYIARQQADLPEGKIKLGVSLYGFRGVKLAELNASALELKKTLKQHGRSARIIANKAHELNSAQVLHGGLLSNVGIELVIVNDGKHIHIGKTIYVQDIDAYAARDHGRPARDARVGMLPPKLAQIIINLAATESTERVLDPFCGTGVVLQEALLIGYSAEGTDLDPRMIQYTHTNLDWLETMQSFAPHTWEASAADACNDSWQTPPDTIACETYLGRPFAHEPDPETLAKVMSDCHQIHKKFLQNVARQTSPGFRMCIAVPAWHTKKGIKHLSTLENLEALGYTRISFVHAKTSELIYHRSDQVVGRELVVLQRI